MKKVIVLMFLIFNSLFSYDLNNFEDRQEVIKEVKKLVLYEESIAKAYEEYILSNYSVPTLPQIVTDIGTLTTISDIYSAISLDSNLPKISYNLSDTLKADALIKALYESDTYRKRTYIRKDDTKVNFRLVDDFAKHLYDLIKQNGGAISNCPSTEGTVTKQNCKLNGHIYIGVTSIRKDTINSSTVYIPDIYLMAYYVDNFKTGPIIITSDDTKHDDPIFDTLSKGALLYDMNGVKYLKTLDKIETLK